MADPEKRSRVRGLIQGLRAAKKLGEGAVGAVNHLPFVSVNNVPSFSALALSSSSGGEGVPNVRLAPFPGRQSSGGDRLPAERESYAFEVAEAIDDDDEGRVVPDGVEEDRTLTALEEEVLLSSVLEDDEVGPAIQAVYERGSQKAFAASLDRVANERQQAIVDACGQERAPDFIRSVDAILSLRHEVGSAGTGLRSINAQLQSDAEGMAAARARTVALRASDRNLQEATELVEEARKVLALCVDATRALEGEESSGSRRDILAGLTSLKRLRRLLRGHLRSPLLAAWVSMALPGMARQLLDASLAEVDAWLASLRGASQTIGEQALVHAQERGAGGTVSLEAGDSVTGVGSLELDGGGRSSKVALEAAGVDMAPLYRNLHVHRSLDAIEDLRAHIRDSRRAQAAIDLAAPKDVTVGHDNISGQLRQFLARNLGFMVLEDTIRACSQGLIPRSQTDAEWGLHAVQVSDTIAKYSNLATTSPPLVQLRSLVSLFCAALETRGFNARQVRDALEGSRGRYLDILEQEGRQEAAAAVRNDDLRPHVLRTPEEIRRLKANFPGLERHVFQSTNQNKSNTVSDDESSSPTPVLTAPATMAFSKSVVRLLQISKDFAFDYANFVGPSAPEATGDVTFALDNFLRNVVAEELMRPLREARDAGQEWAIEQALQLSVNAVVLSAQSGEVLRMGADLCSSGSASTDGRVLNRASAATFDRARQDAEDALFSACSTKATKSMDRGDAEFDWAPAPSKAVSAPSEYMLHKEGPASFLRTTFPRLHVLDEPVREAMHFTTCQLISRRLLKQPLDPRVRKVHLVAFLRLDKDLAVLEAFAVDAAVPGLKDTFAPVRQLVSLVNGPGGLTQILDEVRRWQEFDQVDLHNLLALLEKVKDPSGTLSSFVHIRSDTNSRKKEVDAVIKKLRELVNG